VHYYRHIYSFEHVYYHQIMTDIKWTRDVLVDYSLKKIKYIYSVLTEEEELISD
jgi:hypothetical protein